VGEVMGNRRSSAIFPNICVNMLYSKLVASDPKAKGWSKFMFIAGSDGRLAISAVRKHGRDALVFTH
jgi:hypothetical protein